MSYQNWQQPQPMQPNQLPYNPLQPVEPYITIEIGRPHFIPNVMCPLELQQYLPVIVTVAMNEIQTKAGSNPLRQFAYNMYARNGYNNPEFHELIDICVNYIHATLLYSGNNNNVTIEQAMFGVIPRVIQTITGAQIKYYPQLEAYLPPALRNEAIQSVAKMQQIVGEIAQAQQMAMRPQMQQGWGSGGFGGGFQQPAANMFSNRMSMGSIPNTGSSSLFSAQGAQGMQSYSHQQSGPVVGGASSGAADRYRRQLQVQNASMSGATQPGSPAPQSATPPNSGYAYGGRQTSAQIVPPPSAVTSHTSAADVLQQPFTRPDPAIISEVTGTPKFEYPENTNASRWNQFAAAEELQPSRWMSGVDAPKATVGGTDLSKAQSLYTEKQLPEGSKWKRSDAQPYHPAWNPRKQKVMYAVLEDGTVMAVIVELSESEKKMMEYQRHAIGVVPVDREEQEPAIDRQSEEVINGEVKPYNAKVVIEDVAVLENCEESASIHARFKTLIGKKLDGVDAHCVRMCVATPLICANEELANDYRNIINNLSNARNFRDAREIISSLKKKDMLPLRHHLNTVLTKEVNAVLLLEMGMGKVSIDSFIDDIDALDNGIRKRHGDVVANLLKDKEAYIIDRSIMPLHSSETSDLVINEFGDLEGFEDWGCEVVYAASMVSFTHVKERADELNLALIAGEAAVLDESANAKLYSIISNTLGGLNDKNMSYRRNYIVTLDGLKFEVARGFINKQSLLIRQA